MFERRQTLKFLAIHGTDIQQYRNQHLGFITPVLCSTKSYGLPIYTGKISLSSNIICYTSNCTFRKFHNNVKQCSSERFNGWSLNYYKVLEEAPTNNFC